MPRKSINVHGPAGCGKTLNADKLQRYFGLDRVEDDFDLQAQRTSLSAAEYGSLVLSQQPVPGMRSYPFYTVVGSAGGKAYR